ncbi:BSD-domain-containing protein [Yamadazyma tenuis ATCC 10573]|uniref:BSD-domain-containing protein n=2 Tax=Candida tenuis TaxID=2315449 RepID=G3B3Y2_CANTC|nr:BSD-domain-containing protein [Yamadazyma tenuis ATCC 10573]EGV63889.1 BSD-domain-containing protein [Yamadazyma tenuis ATCC 10573]
MILKVFYKTPEDETEQDIRLTFINRPTMNIIKEALQTVVSRQRTVVNENAPDDRSTGTTGTPVPRSATPSSGANAGDLNISAEGSLSDQSLLKNHQLQQKLLLEDKNLRNLFTQSVINFKLSPTMFWSTRLSLLRTYALTVSQHRGRYNVLSTIKPVATSDNQVNVNVTRTIINEIFETYPIVQKAFNELVPNKFQEGEFWSRFFNSKLFRRLRGDKINNSTDRGDLILDKYLFVDENYSVNKDSEAAESQEKAKSGKVPKGVDDPAINMFIDLRSNEMDNSVKMGNAPDFTMKFENDKSNEMIILMQNMNKLSSKVINQVADDKREEPTTEEYEQELNLHDLNESTNLKYIDLKINSSIADTSSYKENVDVHSLNEYFQRQTVQPSIKGINLIDNYSSKDIDDSYDEINKLIRTNRRTFSLVNKYGNHNDVSLLSNELVEGLLNMNLTMNEFLSHFWKIFLNENNPGNLKKLFTSLKECKKKFLELDQQAIEQITQKVMAEKKDKVIDDLKFMMSPIFNALDKALGEYVKAVREVNENGKRPFDQTEA